MPRDNFQPRRPDFTLRARLAGETGHWNAIGAAWRLDGSEGFRINLNVGIQLRWDDPLVICLFPYEERK